MAAATKRQGQLASEPLPRILHAAFRDRLTGGIAIALPSGAAAIYMRAGQVSAVALPGSVDRLGDLLLGSRVLDEKRLASALASSDGQPLGRALVDLGGITESQLIAALRLQARRRLHRLFFVEEGEFSVEAGEHGWGVEGEVHVRIHPHRAIYQGVKSAYREDRFGREIPARPLRLVATPEQLAIYGLVDADQGIAARFGERPHTAAEVVAETGLALDAVRSVVYALLVTDALQIAATQTMAAAKEPTSAAADRSSAPAERRNASGDRSNGPGDRRNAPGDRSNAPTDRLLGSKVPFGAVPASAAAPAAKAAASSASPAASQALALAITEKAAIVESQDFFAVLNIARDAGRADVKSAYLEAARQFHPDRAVAAGLASLKADAERIFRRVSEANATLSDDARRAAYMERLASPSSAKEPSAGAGTINAHRVIAAEMAFMEGEVALKRRDYDNAIARLTEALELNPEEGEAVALLAWARFSAGQTDLAHCKPEFERALSLSPRCARAHYFLGMAWKQAGEPSKAMASFRLAVEIDGRLNEAQSELRVLQMRNSREPTLPPSPAKGLLDRLRKK